MLKKTQSSIGNRLQLRIKRIADNRHSCPGIIQHVFVVGGLQQSVDRDGHGSNLNRAEKTGGKFRGIEQQEEYAFLDAHLKLAKSVADAVDALMELPVSNMEVSAFDSDFSPTSFRKVAIDKISSSIELIWEETRIARIHLEIARCLRMAARMTTLLMPKLPTAPKAINSESCGLRRRESANKAASAKRTPSIFSHNGL